MKIQYLTYLQIDKLKWDSCITWAGNSLIYAESFYLDSMAKNWDALILGDYEAVMPLTFNKKYGVYYLYQPFFTASLGIFGNNISAELTDNFLQAIPEKFKYFDIYLNYRNHFKLEHFKLYERMNFVLSLQESYEKIYQHYRDNIKRNIKKSIQLQVKIKQNIPIEAVLLLATEQSRSFADIEEIHFQNFKKVFDHYNQHNKAYTYGVYAPNGQLVSSCAFLISNNRAYYILVGNHPDGKAFGASHALINAFIKDNAGKNLLLDFEGSDIPSLAFFYSSFGAVEEKYAGLKLNRLPFWMKWFKD